MRISGIQSFISNNNNIVNQNSNNINNASKNNLERSPMQDTVSFGRFDKTYENLVSQYAGIRLIRNRPAYRIIRDCIYLNLQPTEITKKNCENDEYELELVSYKEFRPWQTQDVIDEYDSTMQYHIDKFNEIYGYESGWEKHLTTTEDFEKAAMLANYLDNNGYFPKDQPGEDDWFKNRLFGLDY